MGVGRYIALMGGSGDSEEMAWYDYDSGSAAPLPGTSSYTRASADWVHTTTNGTSNWYQQIKPNEVHIGGLRRVENLLNSSNGTGPFAAITKRGRIAVSVVASNGTLTITIGGADQNFTPTGTAQRFVAFADATAASTTIAISGTATLTQPMAHLCQVGTDVPEPYVAHNQMYNANVNGVQYFNTRNTSTVDGSGVVTESVGAVISGGGFEWHPRFTNLAKESHNPSQFQIDGDAATITDQGVSSIGLPGSFEARCGNTSDTYYFRSASSHNFEVGQHIARIIVRDQTAALLLVRCPLTTTTWGWTNFGLFNSSVQNKSPNVDDAYVYAAGDGYSVMTFTWTVTEANTSKLAYFFTDAQTVPAETVNNAPAFSASGERLIFIHEQFGVGTDPGSPVPTYGSIATRETSILTDRTWPSAASAVVDTVIETHVFGASNALRQNMLGFGSSAGNAFRISAAAQVQLVNGGISAEITHSSNYAGNRHQFGMSLKANEGIIVDDQNNDNTDTSGTIGQGTIHIGSNSSQEGLSGRYPRIRIWDRSQTVAELKARL